MIIIMIGMIMMSMIIVIAIVIATILCVSPNFFFQNSSFVAPEASKTFEF